MVPDRVSAGLGAAVGVLAILLGVTYLHFGTGVGRPVLQLFVGVVLVGYLLLARTLSWRRRIGGLVAVFGVIVFVFGVYGGSVACVQLNYPESATHGVTYDWQTNRLLFGDYTDSLGYRCHGTPSRIAVLGGYLLATGGTLSLFRNPPVAGDVVPSVQGLR